MANRTDDTELVVDGERIPLIQRSIPKKWRVAISMIITWQELRSHIGDARDRLDLEMQWLSELRHLATQAESIQDIEELETEWFAHSQTTGKPADPSARLRRNGRYP